MVGNVPPVTTVRKYLEGNFSREPYCSGIPPFNLMGGQVIYFQRKGR